MKYIFAAAGACALLAMTLASAGTLNKSIHITTSSDPAGDYRTVNGKITVEAGVRLDPGSEVATVNGSITVGDNAVVGSIETVNGSIEIDHGAQAAGITTVNGSIRLAQNVAVDGNVESVNGSLSALRSSSVNGHMENVNGKITVDGARVEGSLMTVSGGMLITNGATIGGDILVDKPRNRWWDGGERRIPRIVIGPGAVVAGKLVFEREVELYIHDSARTGTVTGADAVSFSGDTPD